MDREDPAMKDAEKKEAGLDRAEPGVEGGWFAGKDAVGVLRRALWGAAGVAGLGLVLLGVCAWYLRALVAAVLDLAAAMKGR